MKGAQELLAFQMQARLLPIKPTQQVPRRATEKTNLLNGRSLTQRQYHQNLKAHPRPPEDRSVILLQPTRRPWIKITHLLNKGRLYRMELESRQI